MTTEGLRSPRRQDGPFCGRSYGVLARVCPLVNPEVASNLKIGKRELDGSSKLACREVMMMKRGYRGCAKDIPRIVRVDCRVALFADDLVCILGALAQVSNEGRVWRREGREEGEGVGVCCKLAGRISHFGLLTLPLGTTPPHFPAA